MLAIEVGQLQTQEFGEADARIVEQPEDGAISGGGPVGKRPDFARRSTRQQEAFELLWLDGANEGLADLGKGDAIKRIAVDDLTAHEPVEKGACRTRVGLDGAFAADLAVNAWGLAQVNKPGVDIRRVDFAHQRDVPLLSQEAFEQTQGSAVPFER